MRRIFPSASDYFQARGGDLARGGRNFGRVDSRSGKFSHLAHLASLTPDVGFEQVICCYALAECVIPCTGNGFPRCVP